MRTEHALLFMVFVIGVSLVPGQIDARSTSSSDTQSISPEKEQNMKINIRIGGKALTATLADNATAKDFASVLPLTLSMKDLFGREKYGDLPKALSENGPRKKRYEVGEIAYWSPAKQFAVYYHQDGEAIPSPGIIPIAMIDDGAEAFNVSGSVKVTIELAK